MPVNREYRDLLASALAGFMRGELSRKEISEIFEEANIASSEAPEGDDYLKEFLGVVTFRIQRPISEEYWQELLRDLAFLKSDLAKWDFSSKQNGDSDPSRQIFYARWHALALAIAAVFSYFFGLWIYLISCMVSIVVFQKTVILHEDLDLAGRIEKEQKRAFHPFANEDEWLAHEGILEEFNLPNFAQAFHNQPIPQSRRSRVLNRIASVVQTLLIGGSFVLFVGFLVALLAAMYASSFVLWPIWLIVMSLSSRTPVECEKSSENGDE